MTRPALKDIVMRPTVWIPLAAAAVLVGVLVVDPPAERKEPARVVRRVGSGPDVDGPVGGFTGKPNPALGALVLEVTERPSPDRAVVRARWARAEGAHGCSLDLLVPEGATLLEGKPQVVIGDDEAAAGEVTLKPMRGGEQRRVSLDELAPALAEQLFAVDGDDGGL